MPKFAAASGVAAFLFTDIEESSLKWLNHRAAMQDALAAHDTILRQAIADHSGEVFKTAGDAFYAVFERPAAAVNAAIAGQRALAAHDFSSVGGLKVRMAVHFGTAEARDDDYFGPALNRCARLLVLGHGGQILVTSAMAELIASEREVAASFRSLGAWPLDDPAQPVSLHQVVVTGLQQDFPPLRNATLDGSHVAISFSQGGDDAIRMRIADRLHARFERLAIVSHKSHNAVLGAIDKSDVLLVVADHSQHNASSDKHNRSAMQLAHALHKPIVALIIGGDGSTQRPRDIARFIPAESVCVAQEAELDAALRRVVEMLSKAAVGKATGGVPLGRFARLKRYALEHYHRKGHRYWISALAVLLLAEVGTPYIEEHLNLLPLRDRLYQQISQWQYRPVTPHYTKALAIEDDDFWKGEPQGRSPTRRDYLAKIVDKLDQADAAVIALDFDVRLSEPSAPLVRDDLPKDYRAETDTLIAAIEHAAWNGRKVVLSQTIAYDRNGDYQVQPDIYQLYGLCTQFLDTKTRAALPKLDPRILDNVSCGYIALPYDMRMLPPPEPVRNGGMVIPFSLAIAKARDPDVVDRLGSKIYYGSYIPPAVLRAAHASVSAGALLRGNRDALKAVRTMIVIVGAYWHVQGYAQGVLVDTQDTPTGPMSGGTIHQNFVEAMLDYRTFAYAPEWVLKLMSLAFGFAAMVFFADFSNVLMKVGIFVVLTVVLVFFQWVMLQIFGSFFDAFIILMAMWLHSLLERVFGD